MRHGFRQYVTIEPVHGSCADIGGKGIANPIGRIWSGAMMSRHPGEAEAAAAVELAIAAAILDPSLRAPDRGRKGSTSAPGKTIADAVQHGTHER